MLIDSLVHTTPDGRWFNTSCDASESRLLREMDAARMDQAVLVAIADFITNDYVLEVCGRHRERLIPCASFNPAKYLNASEAAKEFRRQLYEQPFKALKLHPRLNHYDPLDSRCLAVLDELASWRRLIPVWIDTLFYCRHVSLQRPVVDTIHQLITRFPSMKFLLLHAGGSWVLHLTEAIRDCPNALLDLSFTMTRYSECSIARDLHYLLHKFDRRVVFGSDFPEVAIGAALNCIDNVAGCWDADRRRHVMGDNLRALLFPEDKHGFTRS